MIVKALTAAAAVLVAALLVRAAFTVPRQVPRNFNEGWNAFHAADLRAGRPLYPPTGDFINNYPPLSFVVVALTTPLAGGDALVAGRVVALVSFVLWIAALAAVARALGASREHAVLAVALAAGMMLIRTDYYVGVSEPQFLGHALQGGALLAAVAAGRRGAALAGALLGASLFVKHNLLPVPIAVLVWLWWSDRSAGARALAAFLLCSAILGAGSYAWFGNAFVTQISSSRAYSLEKLVSMTLEWLPFWSIALAVTTWLVVANAQRDSRIVLVSIYVTVATVLGVLGLGGDGVYWNAMFDAQWALALAVALAMSCANIAGRRTALALACLLPLGVALAGAADRHWLSPRFYLDPRWSEADSAAREIAFLRERAGPALCENLTLCFWADKAPEVDFFDLQQRVKREPRAAAGLTSRIDAEEFAAIVLDGRAPRRDISAEVSTALARHYQVDHESQWGTFFVRR